MIVFVCIDILNKLVLIEMKRTVDRIVNLNMQLKELLLFLSFISTRNARLRTRSAPSRRNHVCELSTNYLFKADAIHVSLSRTQTLYTIKQVTLVSATRLTLD